MTKSKSPNKTQQKKPKLTKDILITDLAEHYPQATEILMAKYGIHCIGCVAAQFETLEQGAQAHGIVGEDFKKMMKEMKKSLTQINTSI